MVRIRRLGASDTVYVCVCGPCCEGILAKNQGACLSLCKCVLYGYSQGVCVCICGLLCGDSSQPLKDTMRQGLSTSK